MGIGVEGFKGLGVSGFRDLGARGFGVETRAYFA